MEFHTRYPHKKQKEKDEVDYDEGGGGGSARKPKTTGVAVSNAKANAFGDIKGQLEAECDDLGKVLKDTENALEKLGSLSDAELVGLSFHREVLKARVGVSKLLLMNTCFLKRRSHRHHGSCCL